jgi:hypothetical protein
MKAVHPVFSPDLAPSDCFLFSRLKSEMAGLTGRSPEDILSDIRRSSKKLKRNPHCCLQRVDHKHVAARPRESHIGRINHLLDEDPEDLPSRN